MNDHLSIDGQIIPYKEKSHLKQYNPSKPYKWGYKMYFLCDSKDIAQNFEFHIGKIQSVSGMADLGAGSSIVLRVVSVVPPFQNFKLYHDSWFSSIGLEIEMERETSTGIVRTNRFKASSSKSAMEIKKLEGAHLMRRLLQVKVCR